MKRRIIVIACFLTLPFMTTGCASTVVGPVAGALYTKVNGPIAVTNNPTKDSGGHSRKGVACAESYLGLVAVGDASIEAARSSAPMNEVMSVDHESFSILWGLYNRFCTIVRGR